MADTVDVAIAQAMREALISFPGESDMRRDMELVREIMRAIQAKDDLVPRQIAVAGYDDAVVGRHIEMLHDAGYIDGIPHSSHSGPRYKQVMVKDLSWEGHEFAGAILSDESVWEKVRAAIGPEKLATVPLKMIESVATAALTAWGLKQIGL